MAVPIEDGKGTGNRAQVKHNKLQTIAVVHTSLFQHSMGDGGAYSWHASYNPDAGDTVLLVENTSSTQRLCIETVWLSVDTETVAVIHRPTTNVATAGTTVTGRNLNGSSGKSASANAIQDETGNTQGDILWAGELQAALNPLPVNFQGAVVLEQNQSIGVDLVAAVTDCDVVIIGYYIDIGAVE